MASVRQLRLWDEVIIGAFSLVFLISVASCTPEPPATDTVAEQPKSQATLSIVKSQVAPGETVEGTITVSLQEGWHTYGDPPGDSGMPPKISAKLQDGWTYKQLPLPPTKEYRDAIGVSNGYEGQLEIRFQLIPPPYAKAGATAEISFDLEWLICKEICIPMSDTLHTTLTIAEN